MESTETAKNGTETPGNTLRNTVSEGIYRKSLEALRDRLAEGIDGASERQLIHLAPLAKQLADVLQALEDLPIPDAAADSVETAQAVVERKLRAVQ